MSIDATILSVNQEGTDVLLTLGPRIDDKDRLSITGQPRLRILDAMFVPDVGTDIWGGDSLVILCSKPQRQYRRDGYTRLREIAV